MYIKIENLGNIRGQDISGKIKLDHTDVKSFIG